jgi:hypothetical protein
MNPGEQNRNPFRKNGQGNTAKYFGGRSKFNENRNSSRASSYFAQQPVQTYYSAPAPQSGERKKKPLVLIGAGIFIGIILIIGIVVVVANGDNPLDFTQTTSDFAELKTTLEKYRSSVEYFDGPYIMVASGKATLSLPTSDKEPLKQSKQNVEDNINQISTLRTELNKFKNVKAINYNKNEVDVDTYIDRLKKSLDGRIKFYNYYRQVYTALLDFYINDYSNADIQKVKDVTKDDALERDLKKVQRYAELEKKAKDTKCSGQDPNRTQECNELLYEWKSIRSTAFSSDVLEKNLKKKLDVYVESSDDENENDPLIIINEITGLKKGK